MVNVSVFIIVFVTAFLMSGGVGYLVVTLQPDTPVNKNEYALTPVVFILYLVAGFSLIRLSPENSRTDNGFYLLWIFIVVLLLELVVGK